MVAYTLKFTPRKLALLLLINAQTLAVSHVTLDLNNRPLMKVEAYINQ